MAFSVNPLPDAVAKSHVQALAARGVLRRFRRGAVLIQEGDQGDMLYIVQTGRVRAFAADESGKEITLGLYGPGELIGEMSLDGGPRSANVETLEPSTCVVLTRETMLAYIAEQPVFALEMIGRLIRRVRAAPGKSTGTDLLSARAQEFWCLRSWSLHGAAGRRFSLKS